MKANASPSLTQLRAEAAACRACPLWAHATQTVFGEGAARARIMLVGEQPGDKEDLAGKPFVGPAGVLLGKAMEDAGMSKDRVYITNAVKHFKWQLRGKRRLHKTPAQAEILACHPWLEQELAAVRPDLVIALGATAARSLRGVPTAIEKNRGKTFHLAGGGLLRITTHPSALLRMPQNMRDQAYTRFVADLKDALAEIGRP